MPELPATARRDRLGRGRTSSRTGATVVSKCSRFQAKSSARLRTALTRRSPSCVTPARSARPGVPVRQLWPEGPSQTRDERLTERRIAPALYEQGFGPEHIIASQVVVTGPASQRHVV